MVIFKCLKKILRIIPAKSSIFAAKSVIMRAKILFLSLLAAICCIPVSGAAAADTALQTNEKPLAQTCDSTRNGKVYQGFSGGMMLHTGYLFGRDKSAPKTADGTLCSPQGATFGIGGSLRVHLWKHLRAGFEGFVSTMNSGTTDRRRQLKSGSYVRTGCGGVLADCCWRLEKAWPYIGGTIGGGAMKGLYILEGDQNSWTADANSTFHKQSFFYVTPYVGCDYCMTKKVHLTFRADWMLAFHKGALALPTGPRLYVGFMFTH